MNDTKKTDWLSMDHEVPEGYQKFVNMLCEAGDADNVMKVLSRFQKVVRAVHDQAFEAGRQSTKPKPQFESFEAYIAQAGDSEDE